MTTPAYWTADIRAGWFEGTVVARNTSELRYLDTSHIVVIRVDSFAIKFAGNEAILVVNNLERGSVRIRDYDRHSFKWTIHLGWAADYLELRSCFPYTLYIRRADHASFRVIQAGLSVDSSVFNLEENDGSRSNVTRESTTQTEST